MIVEFVAALSLACPGEYESKLSAGKELLYSARYEDTERVALEARSMCPEDPESFELRSTALILQVKMLSEKYSAGKTSKVENRVKICPECMQLLPLIEAEIRRGIELASAPPAVARSERFLFLLGRLHLNQVWAYLELEGKLVASKGHFEKGRAIIDQVIAGNPRHVRALVANAWVNYVIDTRAPFGVKWIIGGGKKEVAFRDLAAAIAFAENPYEEWEAKFGLLSILKQEKKRQAEAAALMEQLRIRFPDNLSLRLALR